MMICIVVWIKYIINWDLNLVQIIDPQLTLPASGQDIISVIDVWIPSLFEHPSEYALFEFWIIYYSLRISKLNFSYDDDD